MNEINEQAIRLLVREMGPADAARFINQFATNLGDYTRDREELFKGLTIEEIVAAIQAEAGN